MARDEATALVKEYAGLLNYLADVFWQKAKNAGSVLFEKSDYHSAGVMGLLEAKKHYDPARCDNFQAYAAMRIRWSMQKAINDAFGRPEWAVAKQSRLNDDLVVLEHLMGRAATQTELAEFLSMDVEELDEIQAKLQGLMRCRDDDVSLDDVLVGSVDYDKAVGMKQVMALLETAMVKLTDKQRKVLKLHFSDDLGVVEIGRVLKMPKQGVCNVRLRALQMLAKLIRRELPEDDLKEIVCS